MGRRIVVVLTSGLFVSAAYASFSCAESTDGAAPDPASAVTAEAGPTAEGSAAPTDAGARADVQLVTLSAVLLNEISATHEWVELVSTGSTATDVSGFRVADSEKDGGAPKLSDAVTFPAGTVLSPKAYLIVQGGGLDGGGVPCPDGGQSYCFNAQFGISNKSGETLYLLDSAGGVVGTAMYPPKAVDGGESWGRIPNADPNGTFVVNVPTPGASNQAK